MEWKQRIYCGDLRKSHEGEEVLLMGWVDAIRDHGNLLFIHMRDTRGIVQVVFDPKISDASYEKAAQLREEFVIKVIGKVALRAWGNENPNLETGEIEVFASGLDVLSKSKTLPFLISEKAMIFGEDFMTTPAHVDEDLRLQYRYLDLRRPSLQEVFVKRYGIMRCIRDYLDQLGFIEVETPVLTKSTPEGARDYLVPSRVHHGKFYALPQSPQLFKQLLMMSGMDRYFQIVKCFRDEDLRPNRQPEFTQMDLEASFIDEEFIYETIEELTVRMFELGGISLPRPFPRMTYKEALNRYGTDCPDLRFGMAFQNVTDVLHETKYGVFKQIIHDGGLVKGFCVRGQAGSLSKNVLQNEYALKIVPTFGAKGMTWMKVENGKLESNIAQFFTETELTNLLERFQAKDGDVLMFIADMSVDLVNRVLCSLRLHVADRLGLIPKDAYSPVWVVEFPLFELKDDEISSQHHPFTMPDPTDFDPENREELLSLNSRAYDLVMNGEELGGGSIRIHNTDTQEKVFRALGLSREEINAKFGFFLKALEYGAPPHGGLALGLDRVIAMILKTNSIRDVIAFPKNRSAYCPLTKAPSAGDKTQLAELGLDFSAEAKRLLKTLKESDRNGYREPSIGKTEKIGIEEVRHVAKLARLRMNDSEIGLYQKDLNAILDYVETLNELDTGDVSPMSHVLQMKNVWREDKPLKSKETDNLLSNAPAEENRYFKVPKILEG